jgi:glutaminyl-tRNA synthetase
LGYTVMSKRNFLQLIEAGSVDGWDDPRMPTVAGMRRRGITPEAIRAFAEMIGVAKNNSVVDIGKLEYCIRDDLNHRAPRVMCVLDPLRVVIENYPEGEDESLTASLWPHDVPREGSREVPFGRELFIERADFAQEPPKGWHRLAPGWEVRLRYAYFITCNDVVLDDAGNVVELRCTYDPATRGGNAEDGRKPKGTIHWVSASSGVPAEVRLYDRLFRVERPGEGGRDFLEDVNPDSCAVMDRAVVEPWATGAALGAHFQFERQGYFVRDAEGGGLVFNRVVTLRDSWEKTKAPPVRAREVPAEESVGRRRPPKKSRAQVRADRRAADPSLEGRRARLEDELGIAPKDSDVLTDSHDVADFVEAALSAHPGSTTINWVVQEVLPAATGPGLDALVVDADAVGRLCALIDGGVVTKSAAKVVFEAMLHTGEEAQVIVDREGLRALGAASDLLPVVRDVVSQHPDEAAAFRGGKRALMGFFIGQVMRATRGKADAQSVRGFLDEVLSE